MNVELNQEPDRQSVWWSVVQAVAWIVEGTNQSVERAASVRGMQGLQSLRLRPTSRWDGPPVSLAVAPAELLRVARLGQLRMRGRQGATAELQPVPVQSESQAVLRDGGGQFVFGDEKMQRAGLLWVDLWVRADECRLRWPSGQAEAVTAAPDGAKQQRVQAGALKRPPPANVIDDAPVVEEIYRQELAAEKDRKPFSRRSAILERAHTIEGHSLDAKLSRITRKVRERRERDGR